MSRAVIITGASSGIGAATAQAFLRAGWQVGLLARRRQALEDIAADYKTAHVLPCDVTDAAGVQAAFDAFVNTTGRLDVLFNNAGIPGPSGLIDEISLTDWQQIVDVNIIGMFTAARQAFAQMRKQDPMGGRIINNGSISAHAPRAGAIGYTTTKHAITGLTKALSLDGRDFDIACGQIDLGNAETELLRNLNERPDAPKQPVMDVTHAADAVLNMAELPLSANVQFMTLMATKMPFIGRG